MKPFRQWNAQDFIEFGKKIDKKTWIKIGAGSVGTVVFIFFIVWPAWINRIGLKSKIAEIEGQIRQVETLQIRKPVLIKTKEDSIKFIKNVKESLFQAEETSLLLGAISKLADESKVSIIASSPKDFLDKFPEPFNQQYQASLYDFSIEGGYHEIGNFISRIESNPKLLRIQEFSLRPSQENEKMHLANMTISAVSFKVQEPTTAK